MDSPPRNVSYEIPDSPIKGVAYEKVTLEDDPVTPRRKTRTVAPRQAPVRRRRRIHQAVPASSYVAVSETLPESLSESNYLQDPDQCDPHPPDSHGADWDMEEPSSLQIEPAEAQNPYARFLEAVLSDDCSFCQLSQRIFVVSGWNFVKNEPSVHFDLPSARQRALINT